MKQKEQAENGKGTFQADYVDSFIMEAVQSLSSANYAGCLKNKENGEKKNVGRRVVKIPHFYL